MQDTPLYSTSKLEGALGQLLTRKKIADVKTCVKDAGPIFVYTRTVAESRDLIKKAEEVSEGSRNMCQGFTSRLFSQKSRGTY